MVDLCRDVKDTL